MIDLSDFHARTIGIPWCRKEDYPAIIAICEDSDNLPRTWEEFIKISEEEEEFYKSKGRVVERVNIDPDVLRDWCRDTGVRINSQVHHKFSAYFVARKYSGNKT